MAAHGGACVEGGMPGERLELSLCCQNRILSPARLPIPPSRPGGGAVAYHFLTRGHRPGQDCAVFDQDSAGHDDWTIFGALTRPFRVPVRACSPPALPADARPHRHIMPTGGVSAEAMDSTIQASRDVGSSEPPCLVTTNDAMIGPSTKFTAAVEAYFADLRRFS